MGGSVTIFPFPIFPDPSMCISSPYSLLISNFFLRSTARRLLPGGEARRAAAAVWRRDLPGEAACRDCPSEWPVAAVATCWLGSDHAFF